jgi:hypothetical protein
MAEPENGSSPLAEALARVGDTWTLLVVEALLGGPQRFNDLLGQIPGITANILSERLKRLEREGLLIARPYSERPPRAARPEPGEPAGQRPAPRERRQPPHNYGIYRVSGWRATSAIWTCAAWPTRRTPARSSPRRWNWSRARTR